MSETEWQSDAELFALLKRECYTPVVGDILDQMGHLNHFLATHPADDQRYADCRSRHASGLRRCL